MFLSLQVIGQNTSLNILFQICSFTNSFFKFLSQLIVHNCLLFQSCVKARRALRALRGLVRLKSLVDGDTVKRQATTTLRCMQTLARVQSQIRSRRIRMLEENQALQRQMLLKHERELESLKVTFFIRSLTNSMFVSCLSTKFSCYTELRTHSKFVRFS